MRAGLNILELVAAEFENNDCLVIEFINNIKARLANITGQNRFFAAMRKDVIN